MNRARAGLVAGLSHVVPGQAPGKRPISVAASFAAAGGLIAVTSTVAYVAMSDRFWFRAWPARNGLCSFHAHGRSPVLQPGSVCRTYVGPLTLVMLRYDPKAVAVREA
jgi:hypothetical protein